MGPRWEEACTEQGAFDTFLREIAPCKRYIGLYQLRKQQTQHKAYGIFGASDSVHGYVLLSDAVARDWGQLKDYDIERSERNLFSDIEREVEQQVAFDQLVEMVRPLVRRDVGLKGQPLARKLYSSGVDLGHAFGRYTESDFNHAARACREEIAGG